MSGDAILVRAAAEPEVAALIAALADAGIEARSASCDALLRAIREADCGAVLLTEKALAELDEPMLADAIAGQPAWSDCRILLLIDRGAVAPAAAERFGNVVLIERPLHPPVLVSAARSALRARQRQRAERELRAIDELYRHTIELSPQAPWTADAEGRVLSIDPRWLVMSGRSADEVLDGAWQSAVHPDDVAAVTAAWARAVRDRTPYDQEFRVKLGGAWHAVRARAAAHPGEGAVRWYGTIEDVEERHAAERRFRQLQSELIHVSRLSAMGTMAATLAHELNQPLTAIANYLRGVQRLLAAEQRQGGIGEVIGEAERAATRAGEVLRRLRELVAHGTVDRRRESLARLIREAVSIALIDAAARGLRCTVDCPSGFMVRVDRIQLEQVLINLLRNAAEALADSADGMIRISAGRRADGRCSVLVEDSGPGISPEWIDRLFLPFASSKPDGMGIGLSISRTIIEAHGGEIALAPSGLGGAAFRILLPCEDDG